MVKCAFAFGLLAATLAATVAGHQSNVKTFSPKVRSKFNVYSSPVSVAAPVAPASFVGPASKDSGVQDQVKIATAFLSKEYKISPESIKVTDAYTDNATKITHVHVRQTVGGVDVMNGLANVNIKDGKVISSSQTFAPASAIPKAKRSSGSLVARANEDASLKASLESITDYIKTKISKDALNKVTISSAANLLTGEPEYTINGIPKEVAIKGSATAKKAYIQTSDGKVKPVWHMVIRQKDDWYSAHVNTEDHKVEAINNWVSKAESYNVLPKTVNDPEEGERQKVADPADKKASPKGWVTKDTTVGNNVWAQDNPSGGETWENNHRPQGSSGAFDFPLDLKQEPKEYIDAAITQLFYTVNTMHDLSYLYGFDEAAGNFQDENYSGKGAGKDAVVAFAQDGSGTDNANFATPPDGQNGVMRMYIWTQTNPNRDGDFEQDIVAHEFTHGISNRLTGGPANSDCLNDGEAGGMGEGWSDTVANLLRIKSGDTNTKELTLGKYSYGKGIRNYPYSTNISTNPSTYKFLDKSGYEEVHAIGEVWAEILYEVVWNIIDANGGKVSDIFAHDLNTGNAIALQIILDGMKLQPCNPDFIAARDAILQAEQNLTAGKNKCAIWKGFAKRGLGVNAKNNGSSHTEDKSVPSGC